MSTKKRIPIHDDLTINLQIIAEHNGCNLSTVHRHALTGYVQWYFEKHMPEQLKDNIISFGILRGSESGNPITMNMNTGELSN